MKLLNIFKRKQKMSSEDKYYKKLNLECEAYRTYDMSPFIDWVTKESDAAKLACAYCLINCWDWPSFMPEEPKYTDKERCDYDHPAFHFSMTVMNMCKNKAEVLHPGLTQNIWMSKYYEKFSTKHREIIYAK